MKVDQDPKLTSNQGTTQPEHRINASLTHDSAVDEDERFIKDFNRLREADVRQQHAKIEEM